MVTENGDVLYINRNPPGPPPPVPVPVPGSGPGPGSGRRRAARPPPLALTPVAAASSSSSSSRLAPAPPVTSRPHNHYYSARHHPPFPSSPQERIFLPPGSPNFRPSPRPDLQQQQQQQQPQPPPPDQPDQHPLPKCRSKDCDSERPAHRKTPPRAPSLRMSKSTPRLSLHGGGHHSTRNHHHHHHHHHGHGHSHGYHHLDRRQAESTNSNGTPGLTLVPRGGPANHTSSTASSSHAADALRSSANSTVTSRSSTEQASGTERSSVLTKASSFTDLSLDTPDGPYDDYDEGGMSVEDAIGMYLDGFSDVPEEPASPDRESDCNNVKAHQRHSHHHHERKESQTEDDDEGDDDDNDDDGDEHTELSPSNTNPVDLTPSSPPPPPPPSLPLPPSEQLESSNDLRPSPPPPDTNSSTSEPFSQPDQQQQQQQHQQHQHQHQRRSKIILPGVVPPPLQRGAGFRDRYGFQKANHHVTIEQYEAWNNSYSNFSAQRKAKWIELLKENNLPTVNPAIFPPKSSRMKRFVRKGIPSEFRGAAWFWYAGGYDIMKQNPGHFEKYARMAMESPNNDDKEHIERDLHRTFPDNLHFKPEMTSQSGGGGGSSGGGARADDPSSGSGGDMDGDSTTVETKMIHSLRRVLYAFALHNPKVGYTQSLNFIAGLLLLFLPEENAFWMLHIVTSEYLPGTHEISLEGANIDLWILMVLLRESFPHIYSKIASSTPRAARSRPPPLTVNSRLPDITLGLTNWLMSLFIGTLPLETTLRVWDVLFFEGSKTFFRVSLAIFKACENDILHVSDPMEVFQVIQTVPKRLLDANLLMEECFARKLRVGQSRIEDLRVARRNAVREEKKHRSQAGTKGLLDGEPGERPTTSRLRTPIPGLDRSIADSWRHMKSHAFG